MSVKIVGYDGNPFDPTTKHLDGSGNNFMHALYQLIFSGSYVTGGDTIDWTNASFPGGGVATAIPPNTVGGIAHAFVEGNDTNPAGQTAQGGYYAFIVGTTLATWKIKIFAAAGAELAAGPYPAAVLQDIVKCEVIWIKGTM